MTSKPTRVIIRDPTTHIVISNEIYPSVKEGNSILEAEFEGTERPGKGWLLLILRKPEKNSESRFTDYVHIGDKDSIPKWEDENYQVYQVDPFAKTIEKSKNCRKCGLPRKGHPKGSCSIVILDEPVPENVEITLKDIHSKVFPEEITSDFEWLYQSYRRLLCLTQLPLNEELIEMEGEFVGERFLRCDTDKVYLFEENLPKLYRKKADNTESVTIRYEGTTTGVNRLVMDCKRGDGSLIDHISGIVNDVRKKNLRNSTPVLNGINQGSKSGSIGVSQQGKFWQAYHSEDGKRVIVGRYPSKEAAQLARDEAVKKSRGEYARLNFPEIGEINLRGIDDYLLNCFKDEFPSIDEENLLKFIKELAEFAWKNSQKIPEFTKLPDPATLPFEIHYGQLEPLKIGQKFISLNGKYGEGRFLRCSEEDFEILNKYKWNVQRDGRGYEHVYATINSIKTDAHRLVGGAVYGDGITVDHINGDVLNVCRENLRQTTALKNSQNRKSTKGTSKYIGVSRSGKKWLATINVDGKTKIVGRSTDEDKTAKMRDKAVKEHGLNNRLNFPNE